MTRDRASAQPPGPRSASPLCSRFPPVKSQFLRVFLRTHVREAPAPVSEEEYMICHGGATDAGRLFTGAGSLLGVRHEGLRRISWFMTKWR